MNGFYKPKLKLKDMMARGLLKKFPSFLVWLLKDHIFRSPFFIYLGLSGESHGVETERQFSLLKKKERKRKNHEEFLGTGT